MKKKKTKRGLKLKTVKNLPPKGSKVRGGLLYYDGYDGAFVQQPNFSNVYKPYKP